MLGEIQIIRSQDEHDLTNEVRVYPRESGKR